jgi:sugar phosphate isomerase/epimerase
MQYQQLSLNFQLKMLWATISVFLLVLYPLGWMTRLVSIPLTSFLEESIMRFGAMNFPVRPVLEEIDVFGALQMDYLELAMDSPMAHHSRIAQQKRAIQAALVHWKMGLVCHVPTFVYIAHLTESIRLASIQEVLGALETAADMGAEKVVVHPGYIDGMAVHVPDYALNLVMEGLGKIWLRSCQLGLSVCIENMFPRVGPFVEPDDFAPIFAAFPEMKLVLDTGHANIGDKTGHRVLDFIRRFGSRLGHLHVSDNNGRIDEHLPVGHGNIGFKAVARALKQVGYAGTLTLEIFAQDRLELVTSRRKLEKIMEVS